MQEPFPLPGERTHRARAVQRLRTAVDAALRDGQEACRKNPLTRSIAQPLLNRLTQIRSELDRIEGLRSGWEGEETHPFWIELLNRAAEGQTPCGKSPPPENGSR